MSVSQCVHVGQHLLGVNVWMSVSLQTSAGVSPCVSEFHVRKCLCVRASGGSQGLED